MTRNQEWNEFITQLRLGHLEEWKGTREYEYRRQREEYLEDLLETNLSADQKSMVDDVRWELGLAAEHEGEDLYVQGLRDCVWLLKTLGVLA